MAERTLTRRELNRALLARQLLLERVRLPIPLALDLPRAPRPDPETPAPVRFLPTWDAVLMVHARRAGVLSEEHRARIFPTTMPQSVGTFLVDGTVAGTWRFDDGRVRWEPFGRLDPATRREVDDEAERLAVPYR